MNSAHSDLYSLAEAKVNEIEAELKTRHRWDQKPLPKEKYIDMGAFGANTMAFEQWLQFILIPRVREIVKVKGDFPEGSMLATYAIRVFNGDPESETLHQLLYDLDDLVNGKTGEQEPERYPLSERELSEGAAVVTNPPSDSVSIGDTHMPEVLYVLADVLPKFEGEDLEAQLQTYDMFLSILSPTLRPEISNLLRKAAENASNPTVRSRLERAADSVTAGGYATNLRSQ